MLEQNKNDRNRFLLSVEECGTRHRSAIAPHYIPGVKPRFATTWTFHDWDSVF